MKYEELIEKVLNGRSVNATAKALDIPQSSLDLYVKRQRMPDYDNGYKMVVAANVNPAEGFKTLAEADRKFKIDKLKKQQGFVQSDLLFILGGGVFVAILSILCQILC